MIIKTDNYLAPEAVTFMDTGDTDHPVTLAIQNVPPVPFTGTIDFSGKMHAYETDEDGLVKRHNHITAIHAVKVISERCADIELEHADGYVTRIKIGPFNSEKLSVYTIPEEIKA